MSELSLRDVFFTLSENKSWVYSILTFKPYAVKGLKVTPSQSRERNLAVLMGMSGVPGFSGIVPAPGVTVLTATEPGS